jgi:hypothetical protein
MSLYWGVDSYNPANHMVTVPAAFLRPGERAPIRETLYDYVSRRAGRAPAFWGRYLNRGLPNRLQPDEPAFLFARRCRLVLVYNGVRGAPGLAARRSLGEQAAAEAVQQASTYGLRGGNVRIYLDLEGWRASPAFLEGWSSVMHTSAFAGAGGFYGRGAEVRPLRGSYMPSHDRPIHSGAWSGRIPAVEERAAARQFPGLIADLAAGVAGKPNSIRIWSNTPRRVDRDRDTPPGTEIVPQAFGAVGPVGAMLTDTVIWQYRFSAFWALGGRRGTVDLDLATETGYHEMWGP